MFGLNVHDPRQLEAIIRHSRIALTPTTHGVVEVVKTYAWGQVMEGVKSMDWMQKKRLQRRRYILVRPKSPDVTC